MTSVSMRVDIGGSDGIPHTFLVVTQPDGRVVEYGFAPMVTGLSGPGKIDITGDETTHGSHEYQFQSPTEQLTDTQYQRLINSIENSISSPPYYIVSGTWTPGDGTNCTGWAIKVWQDAGITNTTGVTNSWVWNPYGQAIGITIGDAISNLSDLMPIPNSDASGIAEGDPFTGMLWPNISNNDTQSGVWDDLWSTVNGINDIDYDINGNVNGYTTQALNWVPPRRDPLVLDLDGGGITTSGINPGAPILFDMDGDGTKTATGWIAAGEAIVVRDLNGNGTIDSGRELFGDNTLLTHGPKAGQTAANGFEALADLDSNGDGKFDANDEAFASVKLWKDLNQDGVSQADELFTFDQLGVAGINVSGTAGNVNLGGGNTQTFSGNFTRADGTNGDSGTAHLAGSLLLANNNFYRQFTDDPALTAQALALPEMHDSGAVRDMRTSSSNQSCLRKLS